MKIKPDKIRYNWMDDSDEKKYNIIKKCMVNTAMQKLLKKLSYKKGGRIYNLDYDDPEIIYFKQVF